MKVSILLSFALILNVFSRCSSKPIFMLDDLMENVPPKIDGRLHESEKMNYSIELQKQMKLRESVYNDSSYYELFLSGELYFDVEPDILSIYKFYSNHNSLEDVWFSFTKNRINFENSDIRSRGLTNFTRTKSYYEHATLLLSDEQLEIVSFLFNEIDSTYFVVTLYASVEDDYPNNLLGLLYSLKTFNFLGKSESQSLQHPHDAH